MCEKAPEDLAWGLSVTSKGASRDASLSGELIMRFIGLTESPGVIIDQRDIYKERCTEK